MEALSMNVFMRPALLLGALFAIAGCSSSGQTSLAPAGADSLSRHSYTTPAGALLPVRQQNKVMRHATSSTYSTKKSLLFASNFGEHTVDIYQTSALSSNPSPIATISEPSGGCPYGMAFDKKGNLYLADSCLSQIEIYPKGSTTLESTITDGISYPLGVAFDKSGTLYVTTSGDVQEYASGSTTPTKTVTGMEDPFGISLDKKGNAYIADYGAETVWELAAGGSSVTNLGLEDLTEPLGTAVDQKTGYLWVTDGSGDKVAIYQLGGSTSPVETIAGGGFPYSVTIQNHGKPAGTTAYGDLDADSVYVFKAGSYTPYATLTNGVDTPTGLLIATP
jgi:DNA-binding beta-propeller fold protein YncE